MLEAWRAAERLGAGGFTEATVAELRFHGLARRLPEAEAAALTAAFDAELDRLYARAESARAEAGGRPAQAGVAAGGAGR